MQTEGLAILERAVALCYQLKAKPLLALAADDAAEALMMVLDLAADEATASGAEETAHQ